MSAQEVKQHTCRLQIVIAAHCLARPPPRSTEQKSLVRTTGLPLDNFPVTAKDHPSRISYKTTNGCTVSTEEPPDFLVSPDEVVKKYGIVVHRLVRERVPSYLQIDIDELASRAVFDLVCYLRKVSLTNQSLKPIDIFAICRVLANHRAINAVKYERRLKRARPIQNGILLVADTLIDGSDSVNPEQRLESEETLTAFLAFLDGDLRNTIELKRQGWTNQRIASELGISIRMVQIRLREIERIARFRWQMRQRQNQGSRLKAQGSRR